MPIIENGLKQRISNYLKDKLNKIETFSKNLEIDLIKKKFISPRSNFWENKGRKSKFIVSLYLLFLEIIKDRNIVVISFQANLNCAILCKLLNIKIYS